MERLKEAITLFTELITSKKPVDPANYHALAKLSLRFLSPPLIKPLWL